MLRGAVQKLADLRDQIEEKQGVLQIIDSALAAAVSRDERAAQARQAEERAKQIVAVRKHLANRAKYAAGLSDAIAQACKHFKELMAESELATQAAAPIGGLPAGSMCEFYEIRKAVEVELFRCSADGSFSTALVFPGGKSHDLMKQHNPDAFIPLVDHVKQAHEKALQSIGA